MIKTSYAKAVVFKFSFLVACGLACSPPALAADPGDVISDYRSVMVLGKDASLFVHESITVDFGPNKHHGIIRKIPERAHIQGNNFKCFIQPGEVTCDDLSVKSAVDFENDNCVIKIGDEKRVLSGLHKYAFDYVVRGAVRLSGDKPELYWNIVGTEWRMPIKKAEGLLILPDGVPPTAAKVACFSGEQGSKSKVRVVEEKKGIRVSTGMLMPGQGLTLAANLPVDSVQIPGLISEWLWNLQQAGLLLAAELAFIAGLWPLGLLLLTFFGWRSLTAQNANWDSSGGSVLDFGSSGGGFGGGGGDTW